MPSNDARDVLNIHAADVGHAIGTLPRPAGKAKSKGKRPGGAGSMGVGGLGAAKGLAREVQNLGGDNPIVIVPEISVFKRRLASRKPAARWEMRPFFNSARADAAGALNGVSSAAAGKMTAAAAKERGTLVLRHWRRKAAPLPVTAAQDENAAPTANGGEGAGAGPVDGGAEAADKMDVDERPKPDAGDEELEDSAFAKYNVRVDVPEYSEEQYNVSLKSDDWTKEETDYLMATVREFDLRWPLIWDRYEYVPKTATDADGAEGSSAAMAVDSKPRTMEDLKARYYEVASKMMALQKPMQYMTQAEFSLHEVMANFNPLQEKMRKEFAVNALSRSKEEAREEELLLLEVKRILARSEKFNEERRELFNRLDYPHTEGQDISAFKSSAGLQQLLQNLMNQDKSKKKKSLVGEGVSPATAGAGSAGGAAQEAGRRESIAAASATAEKHRESVSAATPSTTKKGPHQPERKKLTEQEEQIFGVSHHDRLTSGPTFRYEKINKLFTHKSHQQQTRIINTLKELDIPARVFMPTAAVVTHFEQLLAAVTTLLDTRKLSDKLEAELKLERAKKAEREKALNPKPPAPPAPSTSAEAAPKAEEPAASSEQAAAAAPAPDASNTESGAASAPASDEKPPAASESASGEASATAGPKAEGEAAAGETAAPDAKEAQSSAAAPDTDVPAPSTEAKDDEADDATAENEKGAAATAEASSGTARAHKRSASVMSSISDKSAKRQKK